MAQDSVTEIFITQVHLDQEEAFRKWLEKIHQVEATFPGFRGVYVQSPKDSQERNWITLLQFDTHENLDRWILSQERNQALKESKHLTISLERHRVTPYAGWFSSLSKPGNVPPAWKQTMVVLLILFPIVMLQLKYVIPLLSGLQYSVATFICNALSVTLIAWPMTPIAIWFLGWWLEPAGKNQLRTTVLGVVLMTMLYLIEMSLFM